MTGQRDGPLIVLDDDPTGTQAMENVPVLLEWDDMLVRAALGSRPAAVHLLTNSRAFPPAQAAEIVRGAAQAAVDALGRPRLVLRGDSTLRAHVLEEYLAVRDVAFPGRTPPLLLVPALPHAGRITVGGVHLLVQGGRRTPLHDTEFAADPSFAYRDARLLRWAEERSGGFFRAEVGREVHLDTLRSDDGPRAVAQALLELAEAGPPAACAPDAETLEDLAVIAQGLQAAEAEGAEAIVRSAPTFVGVLAGNLARGRVLPPDANGRLLVVCGSYVPQSTRQLTAVIDAYPSSLVEVDVVALAGANAAAEVERAAGKATRRLDRDGLAVVATPRERPEATQSFEAGKRIAENLACVVRMIDPRPGAVVSKGGITSAVLAREGLGARAGLVLGPLVDGVALWQVDGDRGRIPFVVFPGNVGTDGTLLDIVRLILRA
jgi:uncharacterized protein YgbK (DUF1537 family)